MENSFWKLLSERDYGKVTVTDIVDLAGVNRNSFYYHYCKLDNLAESAIKHSVQSINNSMPEFTANPSRAWNGIVMQLLGVPSSRTNIDRLALTVGPHTSPALIQTVHDALREGFMQWQHLDPEMSATQDVLLEFSIGGLMAILGMWPRLSKETSLEQWSNLDAAVVARTLYLSVSSNSMPSFWVQMFRNTLERGNESLLKGIAAAETNDLDFKQQVDQLITELQALQSGQQADDGKTSGPTPSAGSGANVR